MNTGKFDSKQMTLRFLRVVRERQPQELLSYDLGFDFNVYNRWENSRRGFYWNDFLLLAKHKRWDVPKFLGD